MRVDEERAAHDTHELAAVQAFFLDDIEFPAQNLVGIRQQVEFEPLLVLELFVRSDAVPGYAENDRVRASEFSVQSTEIPALGGTARCTVLRVEVDDHVLSTQVFETNLLAAGRLGREIADDTIHSGSAHHALRSCDLVGNGLDDAIEVHFVAQVVKFIP